MLNRVRIALVVVLISGLGSASMFLALPLRADKATDGENTSANSSRAACHSSRSSLPNVRGEQAVEHLKQSGEYDSLQEAVQAARYQIEPIENGEGKTKHGKQAEHSRSSVFQPQSFIASNPAQDFRMIFSPDGMRLIADDAKTGGPQVGLRLVGIGPADQPTPMGPATLSVNKNRIEFLRNSSRITHHASFTEWFVNTPDGLEHGMTIPEAPADDGNGEPLRVTFEADGDLTPRGADAGRTVEFLDGHGNLVLRYDRLKATDATGRELAVRLAVEANRVVWEIDDRAAVYPLTVDPTFSQQSKLTALDGAASDNFGNSVALDGETALVGSPLDDIGANPDQGAAYVFLRTGSTWTQQAKLTASDGASDDRFGRQVVLDGETALIGAFRNNSFQGAAYIFTRTGSTWTQQAKLTASDGVANDNFGISVALSGETALVGSFAADIGANANQGAAYVFKRTGTSWGQQAKLTASDGAVNDFFGQSLALEGETALVGVPQNDIGGNANQGAAYVFTRTGSTWTQQAKLTASDGATDDLFGFSVALSGVTALVASFGADIGANANQGAAYVFMRTGTSWAQQAKLTGSGAAGDRFGQSVALSGETALVGAYQEDIGGNANQGAAYVFTRTGSTWTQQTKLTASDGATDDNFGFSVALSGETALVGAWKDDIGANGDQGSAYVYTCTAATRTWVQQAKATASDGEGSDNFGFSVALSGETALVGAAGDDLFQGSAYVFVRTGSTWTQQAKLTASDGVAGDNFGVSVALSDETALVGANGDGIGANARQGSAYVFVRTGSAWTQQAKLTASDGTADGFFGCSVALSGETALVGANGDNSFRGAAYVFTRTGSTWSQQAKLIASDGASTDQFGIAVALSGETALVGAFGDDSRGSAYVFLRTGSTWAQQAKLISSDRTPGDRLGISVGLDGETALVGADRKDTLVGAAYVFLRTGSTWAQQAKLSPSDGAPGDGFGSSVALDGEAAVIGSPFGPGVVDANQGAAYAFSRTGSTWAQQAKLTASDAMSGDGFGSSVALKGGTALVGAYSDEIDGNVAQGAAYVFTLDCCSTITGTVSGTASVCAGGSTTVTVSVAGGTPPFSLTLSNGGGTQSGNSPVFNFTVSPSSTTTYSVQSGTDSNACPITGSGNATVTVVQTPSTSNAGADQTICSNGSATLAANSPSSGTGAWSVVSGPNTNSSQFSSTTANNATFTPASGAGTYVLRWTISNSPCTASTDDVNIVVSGAATTSNAGPDQTVCLTTAATLAANTPSVGTPSWSVVSGPSTSSAQFSSTSSPTATFTPAGGAGTYTLRWAITPTAPCPASTDDVVLTFVATPTTANAGPDQTLCTSSPPTTLAANTPSSGAGDWSVVTAPGGGSTATSQFSSTSNPTATFTPSPVVSGTFTLRWTISNSPCPASTDDVLIVYNAAATTSNAGADQTLCLTTAATLGANAPAVGTPAWSVVSGPSTLLSQFSSTSAPNATFTPAGGAGAYTLRWTITPTAPCPASTDDVVLTFNAPPTTANAGLDQMLCTSSPAATLGANGPSSGTGAWSVVTAPGGGSTSTSQFSSTSNPTATFTPSPAVGGTYTLRWTISNAPCPASTDDVTITYNAAATTSNAGPDQTLCLTTAATLAANTPSSGTPAWSVVSGPSTLASQFSGLTSPTATFTPAGGAGVYTLRWTITPPAPCTASTDDVVLTFNATPTTASAGADQTICTGNAATLGANGPSSGTGAWTVVTGPSTNPSQFSSTTSPTASFTPAGGVGTYTLRWTITNAPCPASTDDVAVEVLAGVTPSNAGADQTLCVTAGSATLAANAPGVGTGAWSVVSGPSTLLSQFSSTSANNAVFTPAGGAGVYTLRWSISGPPSCPPSTDDVVIAFNAVPTTSNAGADQTICTGSGATLAANTPSSGTGAWSVVSGPSTLASQFSSTSANNATFTPAGGAGTYSLRWTISNAPCPASTDDVVITVNAQATASNAGGDQTLCVTTAATLGANAPAVGVPGWSVVSGPSTSATQFSSTSSPTVTFTPAGGAGVYTLRWTITPLAPCPASTDDVVVTFNPAPTANAGADQTLCVTAGSGTLAANTPAVGTGTWSVQSGPSTASSQFSNVNAANAVFTPAGGGGSYVLRWTVTVPFCGSVFDDVAVTVSSVCTELPVLWAADTQNHRVQKFDGTSWTVVVGNGVPGTAANRCNLPKAVVANAGGTRIYVADTGANRITFSTDGGGTWAVFAATGIGFHQVRGPQGLALDGAGNLYVADALNERVLRFAGGLPGTALALATSGTGDGQVKSPRGLAIDNLGNLYVTDRTMHRLLRIANAGAVAVANTGVAVVAGQGLGLSNLNGPEGCAVDNTGNVYVADTLNERVIQFPGGTAPGVVMTTGAGVALGQVNRPEGVAVTLFAAGPLAGQPILVVGDTMNNRIQGRPLATPTWELVGAPKGIGSGVGQFRNPSKLR